MIFFGFFIHFLRSVYPHHQYAQKQDELLSVCGGAFTFDFHEEKTMYFTTSFFYYFTLFLHHLCNRCLNALTCVPKLLRKKSQVTNVSASICNSTQSLFLHQKPFHVNRIFKPIVCIGYRFNDSQVRLTNIVQLWWRCQSIVRSCGSFVITLYVV